MKRLVFILTVMLSAAVLFALLRLQTLAARASASLLRQEARAAKSECETLESERREMRRLVATQKNMRTQPAPDMQVDPKLVDWLLGGHYANIPQGLISALRVALGMPWGEFSDNVLVSKATLPQLTMSAVGRGDRASQTLCAVLAITPEEQQGVESALLAAHEGFASWARAHVQREEPSEETLARYTIPASAELSQSLTNQLLSALVSVLGPERTDFLENYSYDWLRMYMGFLGAVTNTLSICQRKGSDEQSDLYYEVARNASPAYGQTAESGLIRYHSPPTIFRDIFPGGWREISER